MYGYQSRLPLHLRYQQQQQQEQLHQQHYNTHRWHHPPHHPHSDTPPHQPPTPRTPLPSPQPPDPRFPPPEKAPKTPTTLLSPDGEYTAHLLLLLSPSSYHLLTLLTQSRAFRASTLSTVHPEDLIARALAAQKFRHVSDGPRGGIWVVEEGNLEVVSAVVEELEGWKGVGRRVGRVQEDEGVGVQEDEEAGGRWEVLGVGKGGDEGRVFLVHGCGVGPRVLGGREEGEEEGEEEEGKEKEGEGEGIGARGGEKGKGKVGEKLKKSWMGRFWGKV